MEVWRTRVDASSEEFRRNRAHMEALGADLRGQIAHHRSGGPPAAQERHRQRGKLPVRNRIERLLDPDSPFLELSAMAAHDMYEGEVPSAGIVTGLGRVSGRLCVVIANDATVKGGTYYPETIRKHIRAQEIAMENRLPAIYLVDSGGVFLPLQAQVFPGHEHFGRIFYNQAVMSAAGIPQIAVVLGMCTAGGAYVPAMCDENIIVRGTGTIYLGGPPLVKAATGEDVTPEELGGAELHCRRSGVSDHLAENDEHALALARSILACTPQHPAVPFDREEPQDPLYPAEEILGILPPDTRTPYEVREVIARLVDGSRFHEFKRDYGTTLVCAFARWMGYLVGIVANNGVLFSESALKGAHFIELCGQRGVPLIFLQNITGFMVGRRYEEGGITKDGAKMVQAVATVPVPRFTVIVGASHGAGNYAMCGRGYLPRFLFSWPNCRISVMGAQQAAQVLVTVKKDKQQLSPDEERAIADPVRQQYEREGHPYFATARLWDDGILEPTQTRAAIALALEAAQFAPLSPPRFPVFRM